jgi:hypothetical protein
MGSFVLLVGVVLAMGTAVFEPTAHGFRVWFRDSLRVSVEPKNPGPSDEVIATVSGVHHGPIVRFDGAEIQIVDNVIHLDLHWQRANIPGGGQLAL